jgi:hypothetical protein
MAVKRTIRFHDLDGNPVEQDWYFVLGKTDVLEMNVVHDYEDVPAYLASILKDAKNHSREILDLWKEMLFNAVGQREDNLLVKDDAILRKFRYSGAYEQFLSELMDEDDAGASFFMSIMPADVQAKIEEEQNKTYSKEDLLGMSDEEFEKNFGKDETSYSPEILLVAFQRRTHKKAA